MNNQNETFIEYRADPHHYLTIRVDEIGEPDEYGSVQFRGTVVEGYEINRIFHHVHRVDMAGRTFRFSAPLSDVSEITSSGRFTAPHTC